MIQLIEVAGPSGVRIHSGRKIRVASGEQWRQICGMTRRQYHYGEPVSPGKLDKVYTWAAQYPESYVCARCFPGRQLPSRSEVES